MTLISNNGGLIKGQSFDADNTVFLVFDIGQSNSVGRATAQRIIQLTSYKEQPNGVKIFFKPDYTSTDNGSFVVLQEGGTHTSEPDAGATGMTGAYGILAANLRKLTNNTVYIVMMGDGGTAIRQNLTSPDWNVNSTGECFQRATEYYYAQAYEDVESENPGKTIIPIIVWHQGETDAADATARAEYEANFTALMAGIRASHESLSNALLIITKLYYQGDANEAELNTIFDDYAAANSSIVKLVDISDQPRKNELTVDQQGGVSTAGSSDIHTSYLGQIAKAERAYTHIKTMYANNVNDSEIEDYTFDVSTISPLGIWLPFSRDYVTLGPNSTITAVQNLLSIGEFSSITGNPKFKISGRNGGLGTLSGTTNRINSSAAIGSSLVDGSFSISFFLKPRDGQPSATQYIVHDVQNTGTPNNSRFAVALLTSGKIQALIAVGGTVVVADTNDVIFNNAGVLNEKHIAITFTQGDFIRIYVDGILQTLDAINNGDISSLDLTAYTNATNSLTLLARRTGSSAYDLNYIGGIRHFTLQPVVYGESNIGNLRRN